MQHTVLSAHLSANYLINIGVMSVITLEALKFGSIIVLFLEHVLHAFMKMFVL